MAPEEVDVKPIVNPINGQIQTPAANGHSSISSSEVQEIKPEPEPPRVVQLLDLEGSFSEDSEDSEDGGDLQGTSSTQNSLTKIESPEKTVQKQKKNYPPKPQKRRIEELVISSASSGSESSSEDDLDLKPGSDLEEIEEIPEEPTPGPSSRLSPPKSRKRSLKRSKSTFSKSKVNGKKVKRERASSPSPVKKEIKRNSIDSSEEESSESDGEFIPSDSELRGSGEEEQVTRRSTRGLRYDYMPIYVHDPPKRKKEKPPPPREAPEFTIHDIDEFLTSYYEHKRISNLTILETSFSVPGELERFLRLVGTKIRTLNFDLLITKGDPIAFLRALSANCPNLTKIHIKEALAKVQLKPRDYWLENSWQIGISFPKLKELTISSSSWLAFRYAKIILSSAPALEKLEIGYNESNLGPDWLNKFLKEIKGFGGRLKTLLIQSELNQSCFLRAESIRRIGKLRMPQLKVLEIGAGIWEDVSPEIFEKMLRRFKGSLEVFIVQGSYGGLKEKKYITISLPPMPKLVEFSFQSHYEFEEVVESGMSKKSQVVQVEDEKLELYRICIYFPRMDSLERITLGNLVEITNTDPSTTPELHFGNFKSLKLFRVGSPWHKIVKYPPPSSKRKLYPTYLKTISFPDLLKDPSVVNSISSEFRHLKKIYMYLPSSAVLAEFFKCFSKRPIEELHLKTRFDFSPILNSVFCGFNNTLPRGDPRVEEEEMAVQMLKEYGKIEDFLQVYNVELPDNSQVERGPGLGDLCSLTFLEVEHIPRVLRIPQGETHWSNVNCKYRNSTFGYMKYPLTKESYVDQIAKLKNLQTLNLPGFDLSRKLQAKMSRSSGLTFQSMSESQDYKDNVIDRGFKNKLKVKIAPSLLSSFETVKIKPEKD